MPIMNNNDHHDHFDDDEDEDVLSLAKEKLGLVSWLLLLLLWLLAEPLSLDGDAKGAEIQLPGNKTHL